LLKLFWILAALLSAQSLVALRDGFRFLDFFRRRRTSPAGVYTPPVCLIIPCKGLDEGFTENLRAFLTQNYPDFQIIFIVARENDPAYPALSLALRDHPSARLLVAGEASGCGEKVHNLRTAVKAADARAEVLVFADIDARPSPDWLRWLVAPLADPAVTASTGFRWYLPGAGFASKLRAAWDSSIATMLGEGRAILAWGGSMALRAGDFRRLQIAERYWQGTVSDDYGVARAVREAKGRIAFEPRCLVASREESSLPELWRWMNRQIILTRVYAPHLWRLGLAAHWLYALTLLLGLALFVAPVTTAGMKLAMAGAFLVIQLLGVAKGGIRSIIAREGFGERHASCYWTLAPLVPWMMFCNFLVAGFTRRIEWRGTEYELISAHQIRILKRSSCGASQITPPSRGAS
jgi:cellulose synthase/poly-beta-1,6-N-acetylglucosamine synthase-like glycosyltransferase